ncbi:MAG: hypothetical protein K5660_06770 [Paludibacteraceae bacterium]|nr:hypothetical protein [Paludibacteraceae bacterium]
MQKYKLISKITLWVLLAVGIVVSFLFYAGGSQGSLEVAGDFLNIPKFTDMMLYWNYTLFGLACLATLAFVCVQFVKTLKSDPKKAIRQLAVVIAFILLIVVCWSLGSPEKVNIIGYEGSDNVGTMAKLSDACIYLTYILLCATVVAVVFGWCYGWILNRKK